MVNKSKILSDLSKMAVDAMSTFSGVKKEIDTIVRLRVDKVVNKMNLVKKDEFEYLLKEGFSHGEILEINQVVSYFNYANRTVLGLGCSTDGDILGLSPGNSSDPNDWSHN